MSYFDEGSRGVIGSLLLLSKRYTSLLVWLGVIPMVLQLFIGPFAQQALSLPERQIHPGEATIPRVLRYESFGTDNSDDVIKDDIHYPDVPLPMKLAISTGLSRDGVTDSEVRGWSSTGNCTFDIFTSMGVCASVEDVTSTITSRCPKGKSGSTVTDDKCNATVKGLTLNMDLLAGVRKEGSRGSRDAFKREDVKDDQHRESYLGHLLMAPVGRWQKNKDLSWYAKGDNSQAAGVNDAVDLHKVVDRCPE